MTFNRPLLPSFINLKEDLSLTITLQSGELYEGFNQAKISIKNNIIQFQIITLDSIPNFILKLRPTSSLLIRSYLNQKISNLD
jgi:hypothetical protein